MSEGIIFDIAHGSFVDGPGIRTTVFFKGCNLKCEWCHNPESQSFLPEYLNKKSGKVLCGKAFSVQQVMKEVLKDKPFYLKDGGVTFSGGECLCQIEFLDELLTECKKNGVSSAVDTAGNVPLEYFKRIIDKTDIFLYDIKCFDKKTHIKYVGCDNTRILENICYLIFNKKRVWVRIPIICKVNDTVEEMKRINDFLKLNGGVERVELLPYHTLGENKYHELLRECKHFKTPDNKKMKELRAIFL